MWTYLYPWTIKYVSPEGFIEYGPEYENKARAELAATWRSRKRNQKWEAVPVAKCE